MKWPLRRVSAALGWHARPAFLIIGEQKSGTSALHEFLMRHPMLAASQQKETYFFSPEAMRDWTGRHVTEHYRRLEVQHGELGPGRSMLAWYHAHFPLPRPGRTRLAFESTPDYFFHAASPARVARYQPDMKLIVLLRNPIERAYSAWNMFRGTTEGEFLPWRETRSFEDAVRDELERLEARPDEYGTDYVRRGFYAEGLRRWLSHFPREQVLVLESDELRDDQAQTLKTVCDFLGIAPLDCGAMLPPVNVGQYVCAIDPAIRATLADVYASKNREVFELLGRTFDWQ